MRADVLAARVGITYRQVDYWTSCGYLRPTVENPGSGHTRDYPPDTLTHAWLMRHLTDTGFLPAVAHQLADTLTSSDGIVEHGGHLIIDARDLMCHLCGDWLGPDEDDNGCHDDCLVVAEHDLATTPTLGGRPIVDAPDPQRRLT